MILPYVDDESLPDSPDAKDPRAASLGRYQRKDLLPITPAEMQYALGKIKRGKSSGEDVIHVEMLQVSAKPILKVLVKLFNAVLYQVTTPGSWRKQIHIKTVKISLHRPSFSGLQSVCQGPVLLTDYYFR